MEKIGIQKLCIYSLLPFDVGCYAMNAKKIPRLLGGSFSHCDLSAVGCVFGYFRRTEKKGDAPDTGKRYNRVNDPADYSVSAAAYPGNRIERKEPDAAPIEASDNRNYQSYSVNKHHFEFYYGFAWECSRCP